MLYFNLACYIMCFIGFVVITKLRQKNTKLITDRNFWKEQYNQVTEGVGKIYEEYDLDTATQEYTEARKQYDRYIADLEKKGRTILSKELVRKDTQQCCHRNCYAFTITYK